MGCKPCPHHCPGGSGGLLAVLGLAAAAVLAVILGQVVESLFAAILAIECVLAVAGIGFIAYLIRRDRWDATQPAELAPPRVVTRAIPQWTAQALSAPQRPAIEAPRPRITLGETIRIETGGNPGPSGPRQ